jgi:hypothetical protein
LVYLFVVFLVDFSNLPQSLCYCSKNVFDLSFLLGLLYPSNTAGLDSSLVELTDFITAAQMAKVADVQFPLEDKVIHFASLSGYKFTHQYGEYEA